MPELNPAALEFLLSRRSVPAKTLVAPAPDRAALMPLLTAAARSPDHGKLEPWRFIVLERAALARLAGEVALQAKVAELEQDKAAKAVQQFATAPMAIIVVSAPVASDKIPEIEQIYSAGAVCLALLNAALASGWGANWLSGWATHERAFLSKSLGLAAHENVAGFVVIGTKTCSPPERPRPDLAQITEWVSA